jgi:hypothetical protein
MSYQELLNDEVYWGSPESESFHVIKKVEEEEDHVNLILENFNSVKQIKIHKKDLQKFMKHDYVVYKNESGILESLVCCGEICKRCNY